MRRVLEASHVHDEDHVLCGIVSSNRGEVACASLVQDSSDDGLGRGIDQMDGVRCCVCDGQGVSR